MRGIIGNMWQRMGFAAELASECICTWGIVKNMTVTEIVLQDRKWPKE